MRGWRLVLLGHVRTLTSGRSFVTAMTAAYTVMKRARNATGALHAKERPSACHVSAR